MRTKKKYIHVNQHVIRANKKHGTNDPVITIKQGSKNTGREIRKSDRTKRDQKVSNKGRRAERKADGKRERKK